MNSYNRYRFEGKFEKALQNDAAAFEEANSYYDERAATIEKFIDGQWLMHSDPCNNPQFYRGKNDGGWMLSNSWYIPSY